MRVQILADDPNWVCRQRHQEVAAKRIVDHSECSIHRSEERYELVYICAVLHGVAETPVIFEPVGAVGCG